MITLGKRNTPESRAEAERWMRVRRTHACTSYTILAVYSITAGYFRQEHSLVPKLFGVLRERYETRPGGYTRLLHIPNRVGDNAKMAVIELVDNQ